MPAAGAWPAGQPNLPRYCAEILPCGAARLAAEESDFDLDRIALGVGYYWPVNENWSLYSRLTWDLIEYGDFDRFELEGFGQVVLDDEDDSGIGATFGGRWVNGRWEFDAWGRYTSVGELVQDGAGVEFDNDFGGGARAVYNFTESLSLGADYEVQDIDTWSVVFRYRF